MNRLFRRRPLAAAVSLLLAASAHAAEPAEPRKPPSDPATLDAIQVSALALGEDSDRIAVPYSIVERDEITTQGASTLGDVLDVLPGVHADTFGGGASRPVVRGQAAPRVKVLSDGASVLDASEVSPDHAVAVDPLLAQRVEVLRGPSTLLYGSGAVGGVVNVLDDRIPTFLPDGGIDGSVLLRGNTVAGERAGAAQATFGLGGVLALHAEGSHRDAEDYEVPDFDEGRVEGSFARSTNASLGLSWIGERGFLGIAVSRRADDYGLPGHAHEFEGCHPHGAELHCDEHDEDGDEHDDHDDHGHDEEEGHGEVPVIDLHSRRIDVRGEVSEPFAGAERLRVRFSDTAYRHHEIEEGEIATTFRNDGQEARIELQHAAWGPFTGVLGLQHADTRSGAEGEEAFLPVVDTQSTGLFLVEHFEASDTWHFEAGARHEWLEHAPVDDARGRPAFDDTAFSLSGAVVWQVAPDTALTLSAARSERLPHAQELYARGIHLATNTYECGLLPSAFTCGDAAEDRDIETETSRNIELGLRRTAGDFTFDIAAFANDVDDYLYARTLDQVESFRLIKYSQADARFRGFEAEIGYTFSEAFSASVFGDRVHAEFADGGGNLPRISPSRLGTRLDGRWGDLSGQLEYYRVARQDRIADFEEATPGYDMLNLTLAYRFGAYGDASVFVRGSNLLDEQAWNHTSFLAREVPLPGRSLTAGVRLDF